MFVAMITAIENVTLQLAATEKSKQYGVDHGKAPYVELSSGETADFVLDSAYAPSGAIIEICEGHPTFNFSYYNIPSLNQEFSQPISYETLRYGQLKVVLNSTDDRQNFFATASSEGDSSSFIIHHSYVDIRPTIPDKTIRISESTDDGYLTVTVDPASSTNPVYYVVYLLSDDKAYNSTACGMKHGEPISARTWKDENSQLVNIRTTVPLNDSQKYVLNVIASDSTQSRSAAAYQAITVYRGMDPFDNDYDHNAESDDLTWIIWVVLAVIVVAIGVALVLFFYHKKTYQ